MKKLIWLLLLCIASIDVSAQNQGVFSGSLETNFNLFQRDTLIGAANIPQYDNELSGGELWLNLNYSVKGYDMGVRFDMFNNSNLLNPTGSYTAQGIGRWFIRRTTDKLQIEVGNLYDQIGSGIIYQAYEVRPQLIDNSLLGGSIKYKFNDDWFIKGFMGRQKFLFDRNPANLKGLYAEGFYSFGSKESPINIAPGVGIVNRTLDKEVVDGLLSTISNYTEEADRTPPKYNTYLTTVYNTLTYKNFTWYVEGAYKSAESFYNPDAPLSDVAFGKYVHDSGSVLYSSIGFAKGGLGIAVEGKRTENFDFRSDPRLRLNRGLVNFIPPMNRFSTYRLTSRYSPATQLLNEQAYQVDVRYKFNKSWSANVNYSNISRLNDDLYNGENLYQEQYAEVVYKHKRKWQLTTGVQLQEYNQKVYESKPGVENVKTITPFADFLYKFSRKKSVRFETQYMHTDQDFGSWAFALVEVGLAPHWVFEASGMYNTSPNPKKDEIPTDAVTGEKKKIFYPTLGAVYINKGNRYSLRYVKQVQGVVCNGGVCRLEPAFSGIRFNMTANF